MTRVERRTPSLRWRRTLAIAPAIAAVAALTIAAAPAAAKEKLTISSLNFLSSAPIFIAKERGYFDAAGLDVEIKFFQAAGPVAIAVASGDTDLGVTGLTAAFYNLAGKGAMRIVAAQSREERGYPFNAVLVSPQASAAGVAAIKDLKGKSIGITTVGSTFHYIAGYLGQKHGFKLADVQLKPLQTIPNMLAALKTGQVDAAFAPAQFVPGLEAAGVKRIAWCSEEMLWQVTALFASTKSIETRRPAIAGFVKAVQRALGDYHAALLRRAPDGTRQFGAETEALLPLLQKYVLPAPTLDSLKIGANYMDPMGRLIVKDIHDQVAWYKAEGLVDATVDPRAIMDLSFVDGHFDVPK
ncbi:MAG: NrtA/SsuA/CpmA family ABC transporter substrate-binding protein [Alphaproteobacteria bacterium]|nr:NrtA/SsuA/CpmA family ABC transporter substrate-binding protein [Alphaproteobacteria bacterium]